MKTRHTSTGRVTFDERGNTVWEWRVDGQFQKDVDTARLRALSDKAVLTVLDGPGETAAAAKSKDDYFVAGPRDDAAAGRRRSLDDMRRLSEEIKRQRDKKAG